MPRLGVGLGVGRGIGAAYSPLIESGLVALYDFSDLTTLFQDTGRTSPVTADGQAIKGVTDKSGNGNHLSHATGCLYHAAGRNGRGTAKFNKASSHMLQAAFALAQPVHVFAVVQEHTAASAGNETMFDGGTAGNSLRIYDAAAGFFRINAGTDIAGVANTAGWMRLETLFSGASTHQSRDGGTAATGNANTASPGGVTLGAFQTGTGFGDYEFGEVPIYSVTKDASAILRIQNYQKPKWGF